MSASSAYARGEASGKPRRRISLERLREHCATVLHTTGLPREAALLVAESLVDAEARGISSHGVTRTRIYTERLRAGMIDPTVEPRVARELASTLHIDGRNAIGHVGASYGVDVALERAQTHGACVVGVANSNHCGTLAFFTRRVADRGFVAIAMSTAPPTMVYFGGRTRAVGTNPVSIAVPRPDAPPIVVDMATSATARGKIILANQVGQDIPDGWAVDKEGRPTTDPQEALAGSVLPFAGPKGSGLAMMVDLLCGALISGVSGEDIGDMYEDWTRPQRVSHLFIVLDPDAWAGREAFLAHVGEFAARVHRLPPAAGFDQVLLPGEPEDVARASAEREGVSLDENVAADLDLLAQEVGAPTRLLGEER